MNRLDLGRLIASLIREHQDEDTEPWTQEKLAEEANRAAGAEHFTRAIIGSIERGERAGDQLTLEALATALQLTSGERKEFFLAASGIDNERIARPESDPEKVLAQLIDRMKQSYLPAHIIDPYCDVVAVNASLIELLDLESAPSRHSDTSPFRLNRLRFFFSEEGKAHYDQIMEHDWADHAYQSMMLFRTFSLRYRSTEYFQILLAELRKHRLFRRYWHDVYLDERDLFADSRHMRLNSPKWGLTAYFSTYLTALTTAGELHLCVYVPASQNTVDVFSQIVQKVGAQTVLKTGSWPKKGLP